jgi:hypothetical protein
MRRKQTSARPPPGVGSRIVTPGICTRAKIGLIFPELEKVPRRDVITFGIGEARWFPGECALPPYGNRTADY